PRSFRYASFISAVACKVWPGRSCDIWRRAILRSSPWTRGRSLSSAELSPLPQSASNRVTSCGDMLGIKALHGCDLSNSVADFNTFAGRFSFHLALSLVEDKK